MHVVGCRARIAVERLNDRRAHRHNGVGWEAGGVGAPVVAVDGTQQPDVRFLNQVEEGQATASICAGDVDGEPKVDLDQALPSAVFSARGWPI